MAMPPCSFISWSTSRRSILPSKDTSNQHPGSSAPTIDSNAFSPPPIPFPLHVLSRCPSPLPRPETAPGSHPIRSTGMVMSSCVMFEGLWSPSEVGIRPLLAVAYRPANSCPARAWMPRMTWGRAAGSSSHPLSVQAAAGFSLPRLLRVGAICLVSDGAHGSVLVLIGEHYGSRQRSPHFLRSWLKSAPTVWRMVTCREVFRASGPLPLAPLRGRFRRG